MTKLAATKSRRDTGGARSASRRKPSAHGRSSSPPLRAPLFKTSRGVASSARPYVGQVPTLRTRGHAHDILLKAACRGDR